ncbi:MAG: GTPase/DUF3482 domain-containing protein [Desulfotignum sp.]|nr:GTPase/DUF3482 domain-containing protein [Desulfotignum sp.]
MTAPGSGTVPEFAVLGHPNEGKSSVVSTLTEDDQIRVSPFPGETTVCRTYTVRMDGRDIIRFVDTPGFQVPRQALAWFQAYQGDAGRILDRFIQTHASDPFFADECELLAPVARGAGIIYVVNGSRPVRADDLAEMEILRLTGRPRMAIINSKDMDKDYTRAWRQEFGKYFNAVRVFNANTADFHERIRMLETLKSIDQEWEPALTRVVQAFVQEWEKRNRLACAYITHAIEKSLVFSVSQKLDDTTDPVMAKENLSATYRKSLRDIEKSLFHHIRSLFKHTVYEVTLPEYSVLQHDLFAQKTWDLLGLTKSQLAVAGAIVGGTMGVMIDTAAHGLSFGLFMAMGGILGAGSAVMGGRRMAEGSPAGIRLGGDRLQVGPNKNIQLLYILLDRALIYYSHIIKRPHGRRDTKTVQADRDETGTKLGFSTRMTPGQRQICARYFKAVTGRRLVRDKKAALAFAVLVQTLLEEIADQDKF